MIILRCVVCDSERTFYGRTLTAASGHVCADCGGSSWEVLHEEAPALALTQATIRKTAFGSRYTWAYGSLGEYVDE